MGRLEIKLRGHSLALHFSRSSCLLDVNNSGFVSFYCVCLCLFSCKLETPPLFERCSALSSSVQGLLVSVISHTQALLLPDTRKTGRTHASHRQQGQGSARSCPLSPAFQSRVAFFIARQLPLTKMLPPPHYTSTSVRRRQQ